MNFFELVIYMCVRNHELFNALFEGTVPELVLPEL